MFAVTCPACTLELDVEETDRGHMVNCPECRARFVAEETEAVSLPVKVTARRASPARRWDDASDYINDSAVPPRHWLEREDDRGADPLRIVRRELAWPANGLIWSGWIGFLVLIVGGFLTAILGYLDLTNPYARGNGPIWRLALGATAATLGSMYFVFIASGGAQMRRVRNRGQAITTAILGLLTLLFCTPLFPIAWFAAGFGVWALVVLNRPEVKTAFERRAKKN